MTRRGWLATGAAAILPLAAQAQVGQRAGRGKKNKDAPPDLEIAELKIRRDGKLITVDGSVRNISAKPMKGVVLFFEFLEADNKMISRMIAEVTKAVLAPGEDAAFETQTKDQSRAVGVRVDAEDIDGRYFKVDKPGPYEIE
ncbi:MAG: hypothetical protein IT162_07200 [Bryobacterales bacterium]|nr:hypothetical protein [Bryobacterales bacterium]